jgi:hypothetical protein
MTTPAKNIYALETLDVMTTSSKNTMKISRNKLNIADLWIVVKLCTFTEYLKSHPNVHRGLIKLIMAHQTPKIGMFVRFI